jgi:hypothetical protein
MTPQPEQFEDAIRWAVFPANVLESLPDLIAAFGAPAQDGDRVIQTLLCGWDDAEHTRKQAQEFGRTAPVLPTSDGRLRTCGLWSKAIVAAWQSEQIPAEEITEQQFVQLAPTVSDL